MLVGSRRRSAAIFLLVSMSLVACSTEPPLTPSDPPPSTVPTTPPPARESLNFNKTTTKSPRVRAAEQKAASLDYKVDFAFRFEDALSASGISFISTPVDDAGKDYKAVHYDHGTGVSIADVDGDGLLDLYFLTQLGSNQLARNLGGGRFADTTSDALALRDQISVAAAFGDIDNDGDPDLFVTTVRFGNHLFRNDGKGRFEDIAKAAGVDYNGHSSGAVFFDYDRDGRLDLFVSNIGTYTSDVRGPGGYYVGLKDGFQGHLDPFRSERGILYHNVDGSRFEDVTDASIEGPMGWNGNPVVTDLNHDGWPDLYLTNMQGDDHYFENQGGKNFEDRTEALFPKTPFGTMDAKFFDWNNDGELDLYLTDMHSDMYFPIGLDDENKKSELDPNAKFLGGGQNNIFGNAFWQNTAGKFEEISDRIGAENYWPWGMSVGDVNADGWPDIFVTASMCYPWPYHFNILYLNEQGQRLRQAEFLLGIEPRPPAAQMVPWFDLDCSGADMGHHECFQRQGKTTVLGSVGTHSSALVDLDGDGDLDLVTTEVPGPPQLLLSNLSERRPVNWVAIRLRGTRSNRDGIGARVKVSAGGTTQYQVHDTSSGYLSHSLLPLWFGLGPSQRPDRVEVIWPSGETQVLTEGLEGGRILEVVEPAG